VQHVGGVGSEAGQQQTMENMQDSAQVEQLSDKKGSITRDKRDTKK